MIRKALSRFALIFLALPAAAAQAACPALSSLLTPATLQAVAGVRSLKTEFAGSPEFVVRYAWSKQRRKLVVLLGEVHIKNKAASAAGKRLVDQFHLRGFELLPPRESDALGVRFSWVLKGVKKIVEACDDRTCGSTIYDVLAKGQTFNCDETAYADGKSSGAKKADFCTFVQQTRKARHINVALERGEYINPKPYQKGFLKMPSDRYVLELRNERMYRNILTTLSEFDDRVLLVITGSGHTDGLTDLLISRAAFERCEG